MKEYINTYTGEVIMRRGLFWARLYFKRDARRYGYDYNRKDVACLEKHLKSILL